MSRNGVLLCLTLLSITARVSGAGKVWSGGMGPGGGPVQSLAIDPRNPATIYAALDEGRIYRSTDSGLSWSSASNGLKANFTYILQVDPENSEILYVGTNNGIYKSSDSGVSWIFVSADLLYREVHNSIYLYRLRKRIEN